MGNGGSKDTGRRETHRECLDFNCIKVWYEEVWYEYSPMYDQDNYGGRSERHVRKYVECYDGTQKVSEQELNRRINQRQKQEELKKQLADQAGDKGVELHNEGNNAKTNAEKLQKHQEALNKYNVHYNFYGSNSCYSNYRTQMQNSVNQLTKKQQEESKKQQEQRDTKYQEKEDIRQQQHKLAVERQNHQQEERKKREEIEREKWQEEKLKNKQKEGNSKQQSSKEKLRKQEVKSNNVPKVELKHEHVSQQDKKQEVKSNNVPKQDLFNVGMNDLKSAFENESAEFFNSALRKFKQASNLNQKNELYKSMVTLVENTIKGNDNFNSGFELQETAEKYLKQAEVKLSQQNYEQAQQHYNTAKICFEIAQQLTTERNVIEGLEHNVKVVDEKLKEVLEDLVGVNKRVGELDNHLVDEDVPGDLYFNTDHAYN